MPLKGFEKLLKVLEKLFCELLEHLWWFLEAPGGSFFLGGVVNLSAPPPGGDRPGGVGPPGGGCPHPLPPILPISL